MGVDVPVDPGLCNVGAVLAPGPVTSVPLISGLVGGGQVQSKAQVASQKDAQHHNKAQHGDNPWESQEQVLGAKNKQHIRQLGCDTRVSTHQPRSCP